MSKHHQHEVYKIITAANTDASLGIPMNIDTLLEQIDAVYEGPSPEEKVCNFLEQDKALCAQALANGPDVLLHAIELIKNAGKKP